ncbi:Uncharacterised protein [Legionella feeleii]|uniref:Transposase n=1 Tax=Legionella feeleii TaxID=453 RepID=A0A378IQU6_9GAMM|nr:Uncharacterised protein [Legionella feeleii]
MTIRLLGIDLAKNVFQLHGVDTTGKKVLKKRIERAGLIEFIATLPKCLIVMEACGGSNYWARGQRHVWTQRWMQEVIE